MREGTHCEFVYAGFDKKSFSCSSTDRHEESFDLVLTCFESENVNDSRKDRGGGTNARMNQSKSGVEKTFHSEKFRSDSRF